MRTLVLAGAAVALAVPSWSATQYVYPARGQSAAKQTRDEGQCSTWATQQTGFDPARPPPAKVAADTKVTGSGARAVGAVGGAAIAGIAGGNAGTGALVGAATGGLVKRGRAHRAAGKENEANANAYAADRSRFDQARATCLKGRGYTVN
ncbi:MAG: hypothetical protein ACJ798_16140 [Phenylobacterium sp.]